MLMYFCCIFYKYLYIDIFINFIVLYLVLIHKIGDPYWHKLFSNKILIFTVITFYLIINILIEIYIKVYHRY